MRALQLKFDIIGRDGLKENVLAFERCQLSALFLIKENAEQNL